MGELLRRRAMMAAAESDPGVEYSLFPHSIIFENGKSSGSIGVTFVSYNATTMLAPDQGGSITVGNTRTLANLLTDGTHVWVSTSGSISSLKYNEASVSYKKSGGHWMITIPDNFDPSIPFVFS